MQAIKNCNNSNRNTFLMQYIIMTVYILLTMVLNGKFEAMWGEHVTVIFFQCFRFKVIHFIDQDIKVSEKLNNMKILAILYCFKM